MYLDDDRRHQLERRALYARLELSKAFVRFFFEQKKVLLLHRPPLRGYQYVHQHTKPPAARQ